MGWDNDFDGHMNNWNNGGHALGHGIGMGIFSLLLIGLAIWAIVRIAKHNKHHDLPVAATSVVAGKESPREILDRRFANGEVSAQDYQQAKQLLSE